MSSAPRRAALVVVDVQNDFLPGGALPSADAEALPGAVSEVVRRVAIDGTSCIFTRCWHPPDHQSFAPWGGRWGVHCVRGTFGARFPDSLWLPRGAVVVSKGTVRDVEGYSAFEDTDLLEILRRRRVGSVALCGLTTEFCVRATARDALSHGLEVTLLGELVRPVDPIRGDEALAELRALGVRVCSSDAWLGDMEARASR